MVRSFFVDFVVVLAVCMVVWGSVPVWAACVKCADRGGTCVTVHLAGGGQGCSTDYPSILGTNCGTTWRYQLTQSGLMCVIYSCHCENAKPLVAGDVVNYRCLCQTNI